MGVAIIHTTIPDITTVYKTIRQSEYAGVHTIQLYRPDARNALDQTMLLELSSAFQAVERDTNIRVVILEGLPDVFCSGMDFQEYAALDGETISTGNADVFVLLQKIVQSTKIVVARVKGSVNAGGMGLVAACDLVVAEEGATFALSELLFGLLPAVVLPFLIRRMGHQKAGLLALSTQPIKVAEAHKWGLVDTYAADTEQILRPYLQRWRRVSPAAIRRLKIYLNQLRAVDLLDGDVQALAVKISSEAMLDPVIKQGIRRYVEEGVAPWER